MSPPSPGRAPSARRPRPGARRRRRRRARWLLLPLAGLLAANLLAGARGLGAWPEAAREHRALAAAVDDMRRENAALREEIRRLRSEPGAIEALARRELGYLEPGERVFLVTPSPSPPAPSAPPAALAPPR